MADTINNNGNVVNAADIIARERARMTALDKLGANVPELQGMLAEAKQSGQSPEAFAMAAFPILQNALMRAREWAARCQDAAELNDLCSWEGNCGYGAGGVDKAETDRAYKAKVQAELKDKGYL